MQSRICCNEAHSEICSSLAARRLASPVLQYDLASAASILSGYVGHGDGGIAGAASGPIRALRHSPVMGSRWRVGRPEPRGKMTSIIESSHTGAFCTLSVPIPT